MARKRILITGASGCIGHYLADALIQETDHELFFLVRNPEKVRFDYQARPGITLVPADLREIERFRELLSSVHCAVLAATAWGGTQETFEINVVKTVALIRLLDPAVCEQVLYFSTESVLDRDNQPLRAAGELGTDYVRSKYVCLQQLLHLQEAPRIRYLFPTLVLGGDDTKPYSHLSAGLPEALRWVDLIRFFQADGSFHFMHAQDIAQVVRHLVEHPHLEGPDRLVLGNQAVTANQCIEEMCAYLGKPILFRIPLSLWLANWIIKIFRIQMAEWDRFCLNYRHFTHANPVSPATFGLPTYCATVADILRISGIPAAARSKTNSPAMDLPGREQ